MTPFPCPSSPAASDEEFNDKVITAMEAKVATAKEACKCQHKEEMCWKHEEEEWRQCEEAEWRQHEEAEHKAEEAQKVEEEAEAAQRWAQVSVLVPEEVPSKVSTELNRRWCELMVLQCNYCVSHNKACISQAGKMSVVCLPCTKCKGKCTFGGAPVMEGKGAQKHITDIDSEIEEVPRLSQKRPKCMEVAEPSSSVINMAIIEVLVMISETLTNNSIFMVHRGNRVASEIKKVGLEVCKMWKELVEVQSLKAELKHKMVEVHLEHSEKAEVVWGLEPEHVGGPEAAT
jgi:hypothetical protein